MKTRIPVFVSICIFLIAACGKDPAPDELIKWGAVRDSVATEIPNSAVGDVSNIPGAFVGETGGFVGFGPIILKAIGKISQEKIAGAKVYKGERINWTGTPYYDNFVQVGITNVNGDFYYFHPEPDSILPPETVFKIEKEGYYDRIIGGYEKFFKDQKTYWCDMKGIPLLRFHIHYDTTINSQVYITENIGIPYWTSFGKIPVQPASVLDTILEIIPPTALTGYRFYLYTPAAPSYPPPYNWSSYFYYGTPLALPGEIFNVEISL